MNTNDEHDDDLEPEVNAGAEVETENYREIEDEDESEVADQPSPPSHGAGEKAIPAAAGGEPAGEEQKEEGSDSL